MGLKKQNKKTSPNRECEPGEDPIKLLTNYQKYCRSIGVVANPKIVSQLKDDENYPVTQLIVDDENGLLGSGGTRALATAILGIGKDMKGGPYKLLKSIRLWRTKCGDDGARCISELLRLGGAEIKLEYCELLDNNIGFAGALALGQALSFGNNRSLLTLKLDYNNTLGSEGCIALCKGLRTNTSLHQLHLSYCGIQSDAGLAISVLLSYNPSQLTTLNLQGNQLGGIGVQSLSKGLAVNKSLICLNLSDNSIGSSDIDIEAMGSFCNAICASTSLTEIDLIYNRIGPKGGEMLLPVVKSENSKIKKFLVDSSLPMDIFEALHRRDSGKKKKKTKKKAKK